MYIVYITPNYIVSTDQNITGEHFWFRLASNHFINPSNTLTAVATHYTTTRNNLSMHSNHLTTTHNIIAVGFVQTSTI